MKSINEITEIVKRYNGKHLQFGNVQTWMDAGNEEGIELIAGKIRAFWYKDNTRIYGEPISSSWQRCINEISKDSSHEQEQKKPEQLPATAAQPDNGALLPEFLTPALMTKWGQMKTIDRMLIFQKTPTDQIFKKNVGGGNEASYVKGNYMFREANAAFLFDWKFIHQGLSIGSEGVCVYGTIEANVDGKIMSRPAVGYEEINKKMTAQLAVKSATTDAIKKGLSLFGFNSDVYSGEV